MGMVLMNLWAAIIGGAVMGGILSYRTKNPYWAVAGPFVGYVAGTTLFDVGRPWYMFLIGAGASVVALLTFQAMQRAKIDDAKVVPLVLGPAVYGGIVGGFAAWGTKTGGYLGIEEGKYAFQNAEITPLTQLVGVLVAIAIAGGGAFLVLWVLKRTIGLRVTEEQEVQGMDPTYWPGLYQPQATLTIDPNGLVLPTPVSSSAPAPAPAPVPVAAPRTE
jgi:ammonia channel protein AmtB